MGLIKKSKKNDPEPPNNPHTGNGYRRGPQILRRGQIPQHTSDQRLLELWEGAEWLHEDPWRVMRIQSEFVEGFGALAEIGPAVSVFGSARVRPGDKTYDLAVEVGSELAKAGFATITGGGPGVMEGANRGAVEADGLSVGLGIELPHEQGFNKWVDLGIHFRYFFARKTMFVKYAQGFIVLPGGFGTFDETFEALTLVQTGKVTSFPIVLIDKEYWKGLLTWLEGEVKRHEAISPKDIDLFSVTDSPAEAVSIITAAAIERREMIDDMKSL